MIKIDDNCIYCKACAYVCPTNAIKIPYSVKKGDTSESIQIQIESTICDNCKNHEEMACVSICPMNSMSLD